MCFPKFDVDIQLAFGWNQDCARTHVSLPLKGYESYMESSGIVNGIMIRPLNTHLYSSQTLRGQFRVLECPPSDPSSLVITMISLSSDAFRCDHVSCSLSQLLVDTWR